MCVCVRAYEDGQVSLPYVISLSIFKLFGTVSGVANLSMPRLTFLCPVTSFSLPGGTVLTAAEDSVMYTFLFPSRITYLSFSP